MENTRYPIIKRLYTLAAASTLAFAGLTVSSIGLLGENNLATARAEDQLSCGPLNIAYVFDMSTSFTPEEFNRLKQAAKQSIATMAQGSNGLPVNVSIIGFARDAYVGDAKIIGNNGQAYDTVAAMKAATGSEQGRPTLQITDVPANAALYNINITSADGLATINAKIDGLTPDTNFAPAPKPHAWLGGGRIGFSESTGTNYSAALQELLRAQPENKFNTIVFMTDGLPNMTLSGIGTYYIDPATGEEAFNRDYNGSVLPEIKKLSSQLVAGGATIVPVYLNTTGDPEAQPSSRTIRLAMEAVQSSTKPYVQLDVMANTLAAELVNATVETCIPQVQIDKKFNGNPADIKSGSTITYDVTVKGAGNYPSEQVVVADLGGQGINPESIKIENVSKGEVTADGRWNVGTLNVGEYATAKVTATVADDFVRGNEILNDINVSSKKTPEAPTSGNPNPNVDEDDDRFDREVTPTTEVKVDKQLLTEGLVKEGQEVTYRLTVKNASTTEATNVIAEDVTSEHITLESIALEGENTELGTIAARGTVEGNKWLIGTMQPGEVMSAIATVRVSSDLLEPVEIINDVYVGADGDPRPENPGDPNNTVDEDLDNFDREPVPVLPLGSVLKLDKVFDTKAEELVPGVKAQFTIKVRNDGPDADTNVVVEDLIGSGLVENTLEVVEGSATKGELEGNKWVIGDLAAGEEVEIKVTAIVAETIKDNTAITNKAWVDSENFDPPNPEECQENESLDTDTDGCDTVTLNPKSVLQVRKKYTAQLADTQATGNVTYEIEAHNPSKVAATEVLVEELPIEGINVSTLKVRVNGQEIDDANPEAVGFQWNVGELKAGERITATVNAKVTSNSFTNGVTISNPFNPVDPDPNGHKDWQQNNDDVTKDSDQRDWTTHKFAATGKLPITGAEITSILVAAGAALAGGTALTMRRLKRNKK